MNVYRVIDIVDDTNLSPVCFRHTLEQARLAAKNQYLDEVRPDVRIQLVVIPTSIHMLVAYLNGEQPKDLEILRTWKLTARGGLVELDAAGNPIERKK